jgi:RNA polymerase sigma-54 factor
MLKQTLSQKLLQKLSPQQIQFIKLLELNTMNFEDRVEEELMENPALESGKDERAESDNDDSPEDWEDDSYSSEDDDFDITDYLNEDEGGISSIGDYHGGEEQEHIPIHGGKTFSEFLFEQISTATDSDHEEVLATQIIGTLDDDGYLRRPLKNIANDLLFSQNVRTTEEELEKVLEKVQKLDPPGIAARSLQECLLIQLHRKAQVKNTAIVKLAIEIVEKCMQDFTKKHYSKIIKKLDVDESFLKEAIDLIAKLNPKPGASATESVRREYIIPDFIVKERDGELEVSLNGRNAPELRISKEFSETLKGFESAKKPDKQAKEAVQFIKQKLDGAKWFVDAVRQRQNTLMLTMRTIVALQEEFFRTGDETNLRPMILKDVAERIQMDISTISRVASSKYVETDFGIFLLKNFFSEGISTEDGKEVSNREVKKILSDAIAAEDKSKPLTDGKLMDILQEKGYKIARRTVAKYREQLNIPVARLRKELL